MRCRIAASAACSLLLACAISACGGSSGNGVASKSPDAIVTAALGAIDSAKSAHISGRITDGGSPATLNLDLVAGKGGRGRVSEGGLSFKLEVVSNEVYVNAGTAFWTRLVGAHLAAVLQDKWLKAPESGRFATLAQLTDLHSLIATVLPTNGALVKGKTATVNGQAAVGVRDASGDATIYVATTGKPYPLEIVEPGPVGGRITLDDINATVSLAPPPGALDVSKFKK
jgi:hypothetical protein